MMSFAPISLALVALLPSLVSAIFPPAESYAACTNTAPSDFQDPVVTSTIGGQQFCSNYCSNRNYRYAYLSPGFAQCGCSNVGPTAAEFSQALDSQMSCTTAQWDVRIALTTFSVPRCYSGFNPASDPAGRTQPVLVNDVSQCFRTCIQYDGASIVPLADGSAYSCTCDFNSGLGEVNANDQVACGPNTLVRYADHSPGQNVEGTANPGPSTFVKRQIREQLRLDSQKQASFCPMSGKACLVAQGKESWECVDVESELESCGGCMFGEHQNGTAEVGVDCTALPGVSMGGVTCTHGQCAIWACDPGFTLHERECVADKKAW